MVKIFSLFIIFLSLSVQASQNFIGFVSSIDIGMGEEPSLIMLSDGNVLRLSTLDKDLIQEYEKSQELGLILNFSVDENRKILSTQTVGKRTATLVSEEAPAFVPYQPTILNTLSEAETIFRSLRSGYTYWSQCFNRAHIWSYESNKNHNLNSMKVFMFFTKKYIREHNFPWWFHVAPFTYVKENALMSEQVLDYAFLKTPQPMQKWTDKFMPVGTVCPEISKYSDYENNPETQYCYLYKVSMYYVQPLDLENLEQRRAERSVFNKGEIKRAYRNGFGSW